MPKVKFLHCADLHLDAPFTGSGLSAEQAALRRSEIKETFGRIVQLARDEQVELLLISGDLWEHGYVRKQTVTAINELLGSLSPVKVFIAPGNHDPLLADSFYRTITWADNIHIFRGGPSEVKLPELGIVVYGYGYEGYETREPVLQDLKVSNREDINILVAHCQVVQGAGSGSSYLPLDLATIQRLGLDYLALGHIHLPSGAVRVGESLWAYPGSPEPLGFDEPGEHGVILGEVTKERGQAQITTTWVPIQKRRYYDLKVDISEAGTPEAVVALVKGAVKLGPEKDFFRVTLTGRVAPDLVIEEQVLAATLSGDFFHLRLNNNSFPDYDLERLSKGQDLVGLYIRKMEHLLDQSKDQCTDPEIIRLALAYGLDALLKGEVQGK